MLLHLSSACLLRVLPFSQEDNTYVYLSREAWHMSTLCTKPMSVHLNTGPMGDIVWWCLALIQIWSCDYSITVFSLMLNSNLPRPAHHGQPSLWSARWVMCFFLLDILIVSATTTYREFFKPIQIDCVVSSYTNTNTNNRYQIFVSQPMR
jgi:hypothetical protein